MLLSRKQTILSGLVNCGCLFNGEGCDNVYPNCPSYNDPGLNFGNGFYNDHHVGILVFPLCFFVHENT